jgi:hypothetical protein
MHVRICTGSITMYVLASSARAREREGVRVRVRVRVRERGREGEKEGGREGGRVCITMYVLSSSVTPHVPSKPYPKSYNLNPNPYYE